MLIVEAKLVSGTGRDDIRHKLSSPSRLLSDPGDQAGTSGQVTAASIVVSLFVLEDQGVIVHDSCQIQVQSKVSKYTGCSIMPLFLQDNIVKLLALNVPNYYLLGNPNESDDNLIEKIMLRDFAGLEMTDKKTKDAIVNFSIYLSIGNMDEAFKSIKSIKSEHVWENMVNLIFHC